MEDMSSYPPLKFSMKTHDDHMPIYSVNNGFRVLDTVDLGFRTLDEVQEGRKVMPLPQRDFFAP